MTEAELLAAVVANLDDDGPRLVYADWLVERGDPRGELIQLQCARAEEQSRALYVEHRMTWEGAFRERARGLGFRFVHLDWERGFPDEIYLRGPSSAVARLLELAPTARGLVFRHEQGELELAHLLVRPWRSFGITGAIGDAGAERIAAALPRLASLTLKNAGVGVIGQRALARLPLTRLSIGDNPRLQLVAPSLRRLSVERCQLDAVAPPSLESLALHRCVVTDVARLPSAPSLTIASCGLGPDAVRALAARRELVHLDLIDNPIGDDGARVLAEADFPNLKALRIDDGISDDVLAALAQARSGTTITVGWNRKL